MRWRKWGGAAHLNSAVREGISEKVTFELRQKGGKVASQAQHLEQSILSRRKARNKVWRQEQER